jgi:hypothetical protein
VKEHSMAAMWVASEVANSAELMVERMAFLRAAALDCSWVAWTAAKWASWMVASLVV